jgi:hypothetical protein
MLNHLTPCSWKKKRKTSHVSSNIQECDLFSEKNRAGKSRRYKILPWLISKSSQRKANPSNKSRIISDPFRTWWDSTSLLHRKLLLPSLFIQTVQSSGRMEATDIEGRDSKGDIRNFLYQLPKGRMHWPLYTLEALIELYQVLHQPDLKTGKSDFSISAQTIADSSLYNRYANLMCGVEVCLKFNAYFPPWSLGFILGLLLVSF